MDVQRLLFSEHALDRMVQWNISVEEVRSALRVGEVIEEYDDCVLVLGRADLRPLHVVAAMRPPDVTVIVTTYPPDPLRWDTAFRERL